MLLAERVRGWEKVNWGGGGGADSAGKRLRGAWSLAVQAAPAWAEGQAGGSGEGEWGQGEGEEGRSGIEKRRERDGRK